MADKTSIETVYDLLPQLPEQQQREVQDFVEFLLQKTLKQEEIGTRKPEKQGSRGGLGSLKGKIWIAEDFKDIPEGFEDYLPK